MKKLLGIFAVLGAVSLGGCPEDVPLVGCGSGAIDGAEECDGADLGGESCLSLGAGDSGSLACAADCTLDTTGCAVTPGNGIRFPGAEECDDGNTTDGDGCSAAGLLEELTTVTVEANSAALNLTTAAAATRSIFVPISALDTDEDGVGDSDWLLIISTDRASICDDILEMGGLAGLFDFVTGPVFAGELDGTFVFTNVVVPAGTLGVGTVIGAVPHFVADEEGFVPGQPSIDIGYVFTSDGIQSDTSFGGAGTGSFTIESLSVDPVTGAGNLAAVSGGDIVMGTQFVGASAGPIDEPISIDINGAASCAADF